MLTPAAKQDLAVFAKHAVGWASMNYLTDLHKIQCPVLYLAGENDPNHPLESSIQTANAIPKNFCYLHIIPDAGAPVYLDQPEIFNSLVTDFIENNT